MPAPALLPANHAPTPDPRFAGRGTSPRLPTRPRPAARRVRRRARLLHVLRRALILQAEMTLVLVVMARVFGQLVTSEAATALLGVALVAPAWLAGLFAGAAAPRIRWWQLVTAGTAGALMFAALQPLGTALTGSAYWPMALRWWLGYHLVAGFTLAGCIGSRYRRGSTGAPRLAARH